MVKPGRSVNPKSSLIRALSSSPRDARRMVVPRLPFMQTRGKHIALRLTAMGVLGLGGARALMSFPAYCQSGARQNSPKSTNAACDDCKSDSHGDNVPNPLVVSAMRFLGGAAVGTIIGPVFVGVALGIAGAVLGVHVASTAGIIEFEWKNVEMFLVSTYILDGRVQWSQLRHDAMQYIGLNESTEFVHACAKIQELHQWAKLNLYSVEFSIGLVLSL